MIECIEETGKKTYALRICWLEFEFECGYLYVKKKKELHLYVNILYSLYIYEMLSNACNNFKLKLCYPNHSNYKWKIFRISPMLSTLGIFNIVENFTLEYTHILNEYRRKCTAL